MSSRCSSFPLAFVVWFVCGCGSAGPPPQQIAVNVNPATITVRTGDTQQFFATVTGTSNLSVTWSVNGTPGGDTTNGIISPAGLYTPPAQVPAQNKVLVTATSVANSSASQSANVTLANPIALVSFVYPPTLVSSAPFNISVIGRKFASGSRVLLGTAQLSTTFVDSSHLTATGTAQAAPGVLNLTVVNPMPDGTPSAATAVPVTVVNQRAAVRFLEQSTFGSSDAQLAAVETGGMESFLTAQFQAPTSDVNYPTVPPGTNDVHQLFPVFFQNALDSQAGSDQLRQRVMFALNQIWVLSGNKVGQPDFYVPYLRVLTSGAFGNYRKLMEDVTLNPAMGRYLDMLNNAKPDLANGIHANENYAREFMQLFTIGPNLLNADGTPQIQNGAFVPTYTQADIQALARAFTGWTYAPSANCAQYPNYNSNGGSPMVPCDAYHDTTVKTILGATLNAGQTAQQDLKGALDTIFMHPNLPPFVARRMIQHLVTSNPSPQYVTRVASAFASRTFTSNGVTFGVASDRGNMQALIAAVLLDPEARRGDDPRKENPVDGHLREPVLFATNVLRAFHGTTDANNTIVYLALDMGGEFLFNSGSVFNFFSPLYEIPAADFNSPPASPLSGPEFQIFTSASSLARVNDIEFLIFSPSFDGSTRIDLSAYAAIASNDNDLGTMVDAMNLQLLQGTMSAPMRTAILTAVSAVPSGDPMGRARTAAHLIVSSSQYQIQR
jgi:uncharacterized protein (DUF1800 family)